MFRFQKISNYGTSTPAVARTALQGNNILDFFARPDTEKASAKEVLLELQRHLVKCVEIRDSLAREISAGRDQVASSSSIFQPSGGAIHLPGVADLQAKAETFLQSAKLAIRETGNLIQPFYGQSFGYKYHKFSEWTEAQFGSEDEFTIMVKSWEPFVKRIVQMRNTVDHPSTEPEAPLRTANFDIRSNGLSMELIEPSWGLTGEHLQPMLPDFDAIIEKIIVLGEMILARLFYKFRSNDIVEIREIPPEQRDPSNPRRLIVGIKGM